MDCPFVGAEALSEGKITRGQLRWNYRAVLPGVYIPNGGENTVWMNAKAAWLWTGRRGVIAGRAAAALHGAKWIDARTPIEIIAEHTRPRSGIIVREERIGADEITCIGELFVTTPSARHWIWHDIYPAMPRWPTSTLWVGRRGSGRNRFSSSRPDTAARGAFGAHANRLP